MWKVWVDVRRKWVGFCLAFGKVQNIFNPQNKINFWETVALYLVCAWSKDSITCHFYCNQSNGWKQYPIVNLIHISVINNDEHLFISLLTIQISSWLKYLFTSFAYLKNWSFILLSYKNSLHFLDIQFFL